MAKIAQCQSCGMPIDKKAPARIKVMVQHQKNTVIIVIKMVLLLWILDLKICTTII